MNSSKALAAKRRFPALDSIFDVCVIMILSEMVSVY
jgi:hypothetical protein